MSTGTPSGNTRLLAWLLLGLGLAHAVNAAAAFLLSPGALFRILPRFLWAPFVNPPYFLGIELLPTAFLGGVIWLKLVIVATSVVYLWLYRGVARGSSSAVVIAQLVFAGNALLHVFNMFLLSGLFDVNLVATGSYLALTGGGAVLATRSGSEIRSAAADSGPDTPEGPDTSEGPTTDRTGTAGTTGTDDRDRRHRRIRTELSSINGAISDAEATARGGDVEAAGQTLADLESDLRSLYEEADRHGLDDLREAIQSLEAERQAQLDALPERETGASSGRDRTPGGASGDQTAVEHAAGSTADLGPPDRIPSVSNVDVAFDALEDEKPIGSGGNADVTRATVRTDDGEVALAIKKPRMSGTVHSETVERLLSEAETWDKLDDHDHVVGVVDFDSQPLPWIAMEYMDGGHLGERAGELDPRHALWTAICVTQGVHHAHRRGVAHLDLKPANVLFRQVDGAWDTPKVADWGLSKHLLRHSKSVEGLSPQYAAPEQFDDDHGDTDDITDIYQLGAVFYELFTGRPPFEGQPATVMHQVLNERPAPPSAVTDVPPGLDDVLLTAMATDRGDRYESALYLRDDLQALSEG